MSRRRRRSGSGSGSGNNNASGQSQSNRSKQHNQQNQQNQAKGAAAVEAFWGAAPDADRAEADELQVERIRPTLDPAALPRSLGDPPLTPDTAAAHHVAVVYEEAVRAATALAAANGLLDLDEVSAG
jgi:hypothetical protein